MVKKIAINGFGRIGRSVFKIILDNYKDIEIVAINDLTEKEQLIHLLKYDSIYGRYDKEITPTEKGFSINGKEALILTEKDPENLPWKKLDIDIVVECTGIFRDYEGTSKHIKAGAKYVVISAPSKGDGINSYILGINEEDFNPEKDKIIDMGSCTTNCLAPIVKVINDNLTIKSGFMTTIHSYTNDQRILDLPHKDFRRMRAAAINIIPTSTGAAKSISKVIPELKGKLDGIALRVPTPVVSVLDLFVKVEKETTKEELTNLFKEASLNKMKGILALEKEPLVSTDYIKNPYPSIIDMPLLMVSSDIIKVVAWYDNEYGYSFALSKFINFISKKAR